MEKMYINIKDIIILLGLLLFYINILIWYNIVIVNSSI